MRGRQRDYLDAKGAARILKRLREGLLPSEVVESTGYSYAQVARILRKHGGRTAIRNGFDSSEIGKSP